MPYDEIRQAGKETRVDEARPGKRDKDRHTDEQHRDEQKGHDDHRMPLPSVRRYLMRDIIRATPANPRIAPDILRLPGEHQKTPERDAAVDIAHRQVEHGHAL